MGSARNKIKIQSWDDSLHTLSSGKIEMAHLTGLFYLARIGFTSLSNLGYFIVYKRTAVPVGKDSTVKYHLQQQTAKAFFPEEQIIRYSLPRHTRIRILLKQIPKERSYNLPVYKFTYQLMAVCLTDKDDILIDIDIIHPSVMTDIDFSKSILESSLSLPNHRVEIRREDDRKCHATMCRQCDFYRRTKKGHWQERDYESHVAICVNPRFLFCKYAYNLVKGRDLFVPRKEGTDIFVIGGIRSE